LEELSEDSVKKEEVFSYATGVRNCS